jgi:hypothetical protein
MGVAAIVLPSATAFLVAYWHRKQMRQIEIFKRDPNAGLLPPPSRLWKFVKSYRDLLMGAGLPMLFLVSEVVSDKPVTRWDVFLIAFDVSLILFAFANHLCRPPVGDR